MHYSRKILREGMIRSKIVGCFCLGSSVSGERIKGTIVWTVVDVRKSNTAIYQKLWRKSW